MPESAARSPDKLHITNLQTGEGFFMQFNPTDFQREISVAWHEHQILGQSYRPLDYLATENAKISFDLFFRAETAKQQSDCEIYTKFLESLCYPPGEADGLAKRRPPRILVVWPNTMALTAVVASLGFVHEMFDLSGRTIQWRVKVSLVEARRSRLTQEFVRDNGAFRATDQEG